MHNNVLIYINLKYIYIAALSALFCCGTARAQQWTGEVSHDWFDAGNWRGGVPANGTAEIHSGSAIIQSGDAVTSQVMIGRGAGNEAFLTIMKGASLTSIRSSWAYIGNEGGEGTLAIAGGVLTIGQTSLGRSADAVGRIVITNGGLLSSTGLNYIGDALGSQGAATIEGEHSLWQTSAPLAVGREGTGSLTIRSGGRLEMSGIYHFGIVLGDHDRARGTVTIDGPGSAIVTAAAITVGGDGRGTLKIINGGTLENGASSVVPWGALIGYQPGASGEAFVDGAGSSWTSSVGLYVGIFGQGALTISNGGKVTNLQAATMGAAFDDPSEPGMRSGEAGHGTVLVTGNDSAWTTASLDMAVAPGTKAVLTLASGGAVHVTGPDGIRVGSVGDAEINIGAAPGQVPEAPGLIMSPEILLVQAGKSRLNFNHSDDSGAFVFSTPISGQGDISVYAGTTTFSGDSPDFDGSVSVKGGHLIIDGQLGADFTVMPGGVLSGDGTIGDVTNAGTIAPGARNAAGHYSALTIRGDYTGGGSLMVNTFLGDSESLTDRLVLDGGRATGSTSVIVNHTGGGAETSGDGILVIEAINGATTTDADFRMGNVVKAGLYAYSMMRGTAVPDNWYLTSAYESPLLNTYESSESSLPNIRVEVPVYMTAPALASRLGLAMLGTYHDRIGEDAADTPLLSQVSRQEWCGSGHRRYLCPVEARTYEKNLVAGWARLFGETGSVGYGGKGSADARLGKFTKHGPSYDYDLSGFQAGFDLYRKDHADGQRDIAGLYVGYGWIDSDVRAVYGGKAGTLSMNGYAAGAYWTRKGASGWYVDAVVQGMLFDDIDGTSVEGGRMKTNGSGFVASLEGGHPFSLGAGFALEPQAQLIYQHISLDDSADAFGRVLYGDTDMLYGRIGARLTRGWALSDARKLTTWARVNLWHSFGADAETSFPSPFGGAGTLKTDLGGTWMQLGLGVSGQVNEHMRLFASGDYEMAVDSGRSHGLTGRLGLKVVW